MRTILTEDDLLQVKRLVMKHIKKHNNKSRRKGYDKLVKCSIQIRLVDDLLTISKHVHGELISKHGHKVPIDHRHTYCFDFIEKENGLCDVKHVFNNYIHPNLGKIINFEKKKEDIIADIKRCRFHAAYKIKL